MLEMTEVLAVVPKVTLKDSGESPSHGLIDGSGPLYGEETWPEDRTDPCSSV